MGGFFKATGDIARKGGLAHATRAQNDSTVELRVSNIRLDYFNVLLTYK
ncbi:hypothetical protein ART_4004 [Arthrobacter sp. PAMC 25486]|nr:hypothetical protein [Arthrobacter sp. PAMC 25486]AIY03603.1 hypothetical protein ART_4004 [Arthrobacter sp. PAMC 25486]